MPDDIRVWTDDHVLRFLTRYGDDLVGSVIVGDEALHRHRRQTPLIVEDTDYPRLAADALAGGVPGSSAAGEQPKFLAARIDDHDVIHAVLVKWSPPLDSAVGRRWADLLSCEHHALEALRSIDVQTARTRIVDVGNRRFLESERFDRTTRGRRGLVSLAALDAEHVGSDHRAWTTTTAALLHKGVIGVDDHCRARIAEGFGGLIGNTDMHLGNLSFFLDGIDVSGIAPVYDMLPMRYAPLAGEVVVRAVDVVAPGPRDADIAAAVFAAAAVFWRAVLNDAAIGPDFKTIARSTLPLLDRR